LLDFLCELLLILRKTQRDTIANDMGFRAEYSLFWSDFNQIWIFLSEFRKILKYKIL